MIRTEMDKAHDGSCEGMTLLQMTNCVKRARRAHAGSSATRMLEQSDEAKVTDINHFFLQFNMVCSDQC